MARICDVHIIDYIFRMKSNSHQWNPFTIPNFLFFSFKSVSDGFIVPTHMTHATHPHSSIATIWIRQYFVHFDSNAYLRHLNRMSNAREPELDNLMANESIAVRKDGYGLFRVPFATKRTTAISALNHSHETFHIWANGTYRTNIMTAWETDKHNVFARPGRRRME